MRQDTIAVVSSTRAGRKEAMVHEHVLADGQPFRVAAHRLDRVAPEGHRSGRRDERRRVTSLASADRFTEAMQTCRNELAQRAVETRRDVGAALDRVEDPLEPLGSSTQSASVTAMTSWVAASIAAARPRAMFEPGIHNAGHPSSSRTSRSHPWTRRRR